jgi:hypothetical protein
VTKWGVIKMADFTEEIGHDFYGSPARMVLGTGKSFYRCNDSYRKLSLFSALPT